MIKYYGKYALGGLAIGLSIAALHGCSSNTTLAPGNSLDAPHSKMSVTVADMLLGTEPETAINDHTGSKPADNKGNGDKKANNECDWDKAREQGHYYTEKGKLCIIVTKAASHPKDNREWLQANINDAADRTGVSGALLNALAGMESSFGKNRSAATSSAKGDFQFLNATFKEKLAQYGKANGLTNEDARDRWAGAVLAAEYVKENTRFLVKTIKRQPENYELYMAHMLGPGGAYRVIKAKSDNIEARKLFSGAAAEANYNAFYVNGRPRTVGEFKDYIKGRMANNMARYKYEHMLTKR